MMTRLALLTVVLTLAALPGVVGEELSPALGARIVTPGRPALRPPPQDGDALDVTRMRIAMPPVPLGFDHEGNWTGRPDWATMEALHPEICSLPRFAETCAAHRAQLAVDDMLERWTKPAPDPDFRWVFPE